MNENNFAVGERVKILQDSYSTSMIGRTGTITNIQNKNRFGDWKIMLEIDDINNSTFTYVVFVGNWGDIIEKIGGM